MLALALGGLGAAPARSGAAPAAREPAPAPATAVLWAAAAASTDDLGARVADLPARARLEARRAGTAVLAPLQPAPTSALAIWHERARTAASAAATLRGVRRAAGGALAAADRTLDLAALGAVILCGARLALRLRTRRRER